MSGLCECGCGKPAGWNGYASRHCQQRISNAKYRGMDVFPLTSVVCACGCNATFQTQDRRRKFFNKSCAMRAAYRRSKAKVTQKTKEPTPPKAITPRDRRPLPTIGNVSKNPQGAWTTCPHRSHKTGKCSDLCKPCFDVRTKTQLCLIGCP